MTDAEEHFVNNWIGMIDLEKYLAARNGKPFDFKAMEEWYEKHKPKPD